MPQAAAAQRPTVLTTAAKLAPEAVALLEQAGLTPVYTAAYPEQDALVAAVREHRPVALLHRQGLIESAWPICRLSWRAPRRSRSIARSATRPGA